MTSSMLSGERRWAASSRRGGMTVLGKVAVPKPINLPSQRLENHGLDPNVEIVPKGTLSWGGKSTSSASNAWGSSSLSPNTDGGTSSPSHLSARPSSGGSGTRPSTAGSDRAFDTSSTAWGSNSRPSSASGAPISNQTSLASLRPHSAETRPGSSQLSRFAEPLTENSGVWSSSRTTEKPGAAQHKNDEFSLSSGDFPTLGSDKDMSALNSELQDHNSSQPHARPGSSSGLRKEIYDYDTSLDNVPVNSTVKGGTVDSWRRDYPSHNEDGVRHGVEKWQGNAQPYPNAGIPPQHYDSWHGPSVNNPQGSGVWFRGPHGGPPFGNPVAPGGFPIEPFPYYRPHIPPTGLSNQPPVPSPGTGPRGPPKNGDVYRPHMPDAYIRPGIPIRPGFYPGPMGYEGYYGPPMAYCNPSERDVPFMGMPPGPPVYNRYPNHHHPESANSQSRSGGYVTAGKPVASEHVEFSHAPDTAGPYRVLLKQHESDGKNEPENWEDSTTAVASYVNGRDRARMTAWENEQRSRKHEEIDFRRNVHGEEAPPHNWDNQVSGSSVIKSPEGSGNMKNISAKKLDGAASDVLEISPKSSAPKDASLIKKIEGLNAKARDNSSARFKEEQRNKIHAGSALVNRVENEVAGAAFPVRTHHANEVINPTHHEVGASGGENNFEPLSVSGTTTSRQAAQGRGDHRNKGKLTNQDPDGWRKKSVVPDSSASSGALLEAPNVLVGDHRISIETYDRSGSYNQARYDGESVQTRLDSVDDPAQRAKMKELAKQRTKQLQEEEEERIRKQKAKALAKLDELNRRSQIVAGSTQKEYAASSGIQNKLEESQPSESAVVAGKSGVVKSAGSSNTNTVYQINDTSISKVEKAPILSIDPPLETQKNSGKEPPLIQNLPQGVNSADAIDSSKAHNNFASKQKQMRYKQKQGNASEKTLSEKVSTTSTSLKFENDKVVDANMSSGNVTNEVSSAMIEPSVSQKKKNNRNSKNKQKVEDSSSLTAPPLSPKEPNISKSSVASDKPKASDCELDLESPQPASLSKDSNQFSEQSRLFANEESHVRMNSQWKSQHSRKTPRNLQTNRPAEKSHGSDAVIWAPVKPQNKTEVIDESSEKSNTETINPVKSDQQVHSLKNKRAEMERYIPKPVAKEMAQQGSMQQVVSSICEAAADEDVRRVDSGSQSTQIAQHTNSAVGKVGSGVEAKHRDGRHTKQGKAHGSWQQRNLTQPTNVHDMQDALDHGLNSVTNVPRPTEHQKSENSLVRRQTKHSNDSSVLDGLSSPVIRDSAAPVSVPVIKDHTVAGRGRRGPFRGNKGPGVNRDADHKNSALETEKIETHVLPSEHSQADAGATVKENRGVGERSMSHWQPKSQASNNQRGNRPSDQIIGSVAGVNQKDRALGGESIPAGHDKESNAHVTQRHHDQSISEKGKDVEAPHFRNQESRERKNPPSKRRPLSPNQVSSVEQAPTSMDQRHEQRPLSGFGRNGNQNRFGRGHEPRGEWKSSAQDNRQYNHQPKNRERQGSNMHYEYQPVGPYDDSKPENFERLRDGNHGGPRDGNHGGGRFRERSQTHSRRGGGNFYERQGGTD